jgi:hypothetical protein
MNMKTIAEIRLENLELLIAELGTQERVAESGSTSSVYLSQIRNQSPDAKTGKLRQMGDEMARKLESGCRKERGWMDNQHQDATGYTTHQDRHTTIATAREPTPFPIRQERYDAWTMAAIDLLQKLDIGQRQAMLARMREYTQFLEPPRIGQAL